MTYSVEKQEKSVVKFVFTLDKEDWEKAIALAFQKDKNKFQIPGFRKGKAPRSFVEKVYGKGVFFETAINETIPGNYSQALTEHPELDPVSNPEFDIEDLSDDGAKIAVYVTVKPEVKLGEYKGLTVEKNVYPVDAETVDAEIKRAQERAGRLVDVEGRSAENGDTVVIDYSGSVDGVKFAGGTAEKQNLELGSGMFIPGFEEQVVGMNVGDEKDINVKFPENYGS
ncbi:MAG: trigger factor [Clostridia bacterium]|nr:trigger factor [Clostridia bacterium]